MIVKQAGKKVNFEYMDKAQKHNSDGYGVAWHEDDIIKTYKTFNYNQFKGVVSALIGHTIIVHLRNATRGLVEYDAIHPLDTQSGMLFHNGTIQGFGNEITSDTQDFANMLNECDYSRIEDIKPLIQPYINDRINRLVFFEDNGEITILNKELGIEEEGVWYSNDYHLKAEGWCRSSGFKKVVKNPEAAINTNVIEKQHKVFVYGTLKRGYANNKHLLGTSVYLGKATTTEKWVMVGAGKLFPYVLTQDLVGKNIVGEVYAVTTKVLKTLDILEGSPTHYHKVDIKVNYTDTKEEEAVTMYIKTHYNAEDIDTTKALTEWVG